MSKRARLASEWAVGCVFVGSLLVVGCGGSDDDVTSDGGSGDSAVSTDSRPIRDGGGPDLSDVFEAIEVDTDSGSADTGAVEEVGPHLGPAPVALHSAGNYVVLAQSAISTVPASAITGDLGISPAAASFVTGFSMTRVGTYWTSKQVTGKIFAANNDPPTPTLLTVAMGDMRLAYTDAAGRITPDYLNLGAGAIGGKVLSPGLYKWTSSVSIDVDVTLAGAPDDTWIFQISGDLTSATAKQVLLSGGARARNIVWQVAGRVSLGVSSHFEGVILGKTAVVMRTGASINGRLYAQTAVNLDSNVAILPSP